MDYVLLCQSRLVCSHMCDCSVILIGWYCYVVRALLICVEMWLDGLGCVEGRLSWVGNGLVCSLIS